MGPHGHTCRDLLSPSGDPNLKVTRRYKRKLEETNHVVTVSRVPLFMPLLRSHVGPSAALTVWASRKYQPFAVLL